MHLCRNLFASFQRGMTSNLGGLHTVFSHGFCNKFAPGLQGRNCQFPTSVTTARGRGRTYDRGIFLLRTLDNGVDSALVEECNGIPILIVSPYTCSMCVAIAQKEE